MKIFLGYASEHVEIAKDLYAFLISLGHEVWFDKESLLPGVEWDRERSGGQEGADLIVHLISAEILHRRGVVNREIRHTLRLADDQPFGAIFAAFVRVEDFRIPVELTRFQYVDYFSEDWKRKLRQTIEARSSQLYGPGLGLPREEVISTRSEAAGPTLVEFSDSSDRYDCQGAYLVYPGRSLYWQFVNAEMASKALGEFFDMRRDFLEFGENTIRPDAKFAWEMRCEEFFAEGEIVSARFYSYYDTGGAHPNHHITTRNFLGEKRGSVSIEQLLGRKEATARKVLGYCETVLRASLESAQPTFFADHLKDDVQSIWELLSQYGVDRRGVTINLSPYSILPYVFGSHEIPVPWQFIGSDLAPDFANLPNELAVRALGFDNQ